LRDPRRFPRKLRAESFGARVTMETKLFGRLKETEIAIPRPEEMDSIAAAYSRIVQEGRASDEDFQLLRSLARTLIDRERLDAIVLAGTDLAVVFNPENTDFPHLDGARVHVDAIMRQL